MRTVFRLSMVRCGVLCVLLMLAIAPSVRGQFDADAARRALLKDVNVIGRPGVPGPIAVFGPTAFPVVIGGDANRQEAVVAAAVWNRGRVVAFGHGGYFSRGTLRTGETAQLLLNAAYWCAGARNEERLIDVLVVSANDVAALLNEHPESFRVQSVDARALTSIDSAVDLVIADASDYRGEAQRRSLEAFIRRGGGLMTASLGWGYLQVNRGRNLIDDHPGNLLLADAGLAWADGYLDGTHTSGYAVTESIPELLNAGAALERLLGDSSNEAIAPNDAAQASHVVMQAARVLPERDRFLRPRLRTLLQRRDLVLAPSEKSPLRQRDALARLVLALQIDAWKRDPMARQVAHPGAAAFPGAVPDDAPRVDRAVLIDASIPDWHSTGLYAAAGDVIELRTPSPHVNQGFRVRIGAHKDQLWHHDAWRRVPEITVSVPIVEEVMRVSSPFGGPIYIEVPRQTSGESFEVLIRRAVAAPHFVSGETSLDDWQREIRHAPGPWAELEGKRFILTVPSEVVRTLDDPQALMDAWDDVLDACADLAAIPRERARPERMVPDVQISAGYMHSGYPIMTHLDVRETMVDRDIILQRKPGSVWGFFHELGHNHQKGEWTFGGTGEVTCNLFALYVLETVCGQSVSSGHGGVSNEQRTRRTLKYFAEDGDFNRWKREPFLALEMYIQLREAFGWEPFKKVFAEYRDLDRAARPGNDGEKRDQWMVRFSRTVGRNLGPFFEAWRVPTSEAARESISDLPVWMPEGFPPVTSRD